MSTHPFCRPPLRGALAAWQKILQAHNFPTETVWIFAENLCVEAVPATPGGLRLNFQTAFTPPADDALEIAYEHFAETNARLVLYRLGDCSRGSVCILLCDPWFENRDRRDGFERRDDWGISFFAGGAGEIEEVTQLPHWLRRVKHHRAFRDLDFAMSLATVDELKIHGRTLQPYERFAENLLSRLRRMLGSRA